jgi:hypothetical protein
MQCAKRKLSSGVSALSGSDAFDPTFFKRKERTKVYAGRRKLKEEQTDVPTLLQLCQRFLQEHIDCEFS